MATIRDIARAAGVSPSTVTKALGGSPGVSEAKRTLIRRLCQELDYQPNRLAKSLARSQLRLGVLLPSDWPVYHEPIRQGILHALDTLQDFRLESSILYYSAADAAPGLSQMQTLLSHKPDGILFCPGGRHDYHELLELAAAAPTPIPLGIVGDRCGGRYPGLFTLEADARSSTRTAASFLRMTMHDAGPAAILVGSLEIASHAQKAAVFRELFPDRPVIILESGDRDDRAETLIGALLLEEPRLQGLYLASSAADGALKALRRHAGTLRVVATDLSQTVRAALQSGSVSAVVDQTPFLQGMQAVYCLDRYLSEHRAPPPQILLPPRLYLAGNLPDEQPPQILPYRLREELTLL